jgi:hypothetical protein
MPRVQDHHAVPVRANRLHRHDYFLPDALAQRERVDGL